MATARRDYYEVLGVSRGAGEREIKKAFRSLARELHPDVSDHPEAEVRFREAAEAYEVLSKSETRELYDRYGHDGLRTGGYVPTDFSSLSDLFSAFFGEDILGRTGGARSSRGADILAEVEIGLAEAARGTVQTVPFPAAVACSACSGSGAAAGTAPETCPHCGGAGRLQAISNSVFGQFVRTQTCPTCSGRGRVTPTPCPECDGEGRVTEERSLEVEIPAGIHDGQRIRLSGEGHAGGPGAHAGDVYVLVRVRPDERLVRDGNDVISSVSLTMSEAALGVTVTVPGLDGDLEIEFEPGTQPGEVRVLRSKGMPVLQGFGRGDHRVLVNVVVPRHLSDEQRRLLEQFEEHTTDHTYKDDAGFFDKIRAAFR
ncbi:MAG: J domain-containing protein [Gaiellaceae bacterium]